MKSCLIIGAGIVGLATAYQLRKLAPHLDIQILEKEPQVAMHQTGHNSGVVHSGIYYKPGSLKAQNCVQGRELLLEFCRLHEIPTEKCGKVVIATQESELPRLENIFKRGTANGVPNLKLIGPAELRDLEPHATALQALHVPGCHIIDFKRVAQTLANLFQNEGGVIHFNHPAETIRNAGDQWIVETPQKTFSADFIVTCGGLHSDRLARLTTQDLPWQILPFRGEYYKLKEEKNT